MLLHLLSQRGEEGCEINNRHSQSYEQQYRTQKHSTLNTVHDKADNRGSCENRGKDDWTLIELEALEYIEDEKVLIVNFTKFHGYGHKSTIA